MGGRIHMCSPVESTFIYLYTLCCIPNMEVHTIFYMIFLAIASSISSTHMYSDWSSLSVHTPVLVHDVLYPNDQEDWDDDGEEDSNGEESASQLMLKVLLTYSYIRSLTLSGTGNEALCVITCALHATLSIAVLTQYQYTLT